MSEAASLVPATKAAEPRPYRCVARQTFARGDGCRWQAGEGGARLSIMSACGQHRRKWLEVSLCAGASAPRSPCGRDRAGCLPSRALVASLHLLRRRKCAPFALRLLLFSALSAPFCPLLPLCVCVHPCVRVCACVCAVVSPALGAIHTVEPASAAALAALRVRLFCRVSFIRVGRRCPSCGLFFLLFLSDARRTRPPQQCGRNALPLLRLALHSIMCERAVD